MREALRNFSLSKSSRTYALTTRMAETFSCTDSFRSSYFLKAAEKYRLALDMMKMRQQARIITATR